MCSPPRLPFPCPDLQASRLCLAHPPAGNAVRGVGSSFWPGGQVLDTAGRPVHADGCSALPPRGLVRIASPRHALLCSSAPPLHDFSLSPSPVGRLTPHPLPPAATARQLPQLSRSRRMCPVPRPIHAFRPARPAPCRPVPPRLWTIAVLPADAAAHCMRKVTGPMPPGPNEGEAARESKNARGAAGGQCPA